MNAHSQARARGDRRGQHIAAEKARRSVTAALAAFEYGKRSIRTKRIKDMMRDA